MKRRVFRVDADGFNGAWYPAADGSDRGMILMLGYYYGYEPTPQVVD